MAKTNSTEVFIAEIVADLDVITQYNNLMKASVAKDSIYIRAKESLQSFFASSNMTDPDKAAILSNMLTSMTTSITNQAMSTALAIAKENREGKYAISKVIADILVTKEQADKLAADNLVATANASKISQDTTNAIIQGWKLQSDMVRENGITAFPSLTSTALPISNVGNKGIKWEQEQQTKMSVYATMAKSYRESGLVSWTVDSATNKINSIIDLLPATPGLTHAQTKVAIRQELGFDDNKRQHAANSSANMIGLLLSAEESGNITAADVNLWRSAVGYLNTASNGVPSPIPGTITVTAPPASISKAAGVVLSGTTTSITPGTAVTVLILRGTTKSNIPASMVQVDGTWSVTVNVSDIDTLTTGVATVALEVVDSTGMIREDDSFTSVTIA